MPGGFPALSARWLANRVIPVLFMTAVLAGFYALHRRNTIMLRAVMLGITTYWLVAAITATIVFPWSALKFGAPAFAWSAYVAFACWRSITELSYASSQAATLLSVALGSAIGITAPLTRRSESTIGWLLGPLCKENH